MVLISVKGCWKSWRMKFTNKKIEMNIKSKSRIFKMMKNVMMIYKKEKGPLKYRRKKSIGFVM